MFKRRKKPRTYAESNQQQAFFKLLRLKYPWLRPYAFSIPNGGKRNPREAKRLVAEGLTRGVPDVQICYPSGRAHGLFIEFKSDAGSLTKEQKDMFYRLLSAGYKCYLCRSFNEAIDRVEEYLAEQESDKIQNILNS